MQRGKYPVKDVEASYQGTAKAGYDNSFKMCMITIGVFLLICIILLLCTLPFTSHEPMQESQPSQSQPLPHPGTGAHTDDRPNNNEEENWPYWPVPEEEEDDDESNFSNTTPGRRRKIPNVEAHTTLGRASTSTEINVLREENEYEHAAAENGKDSRTNATHREPPVLVDTDDSSSEVEDEQENGNENDQLPPHPNVPHQEYTSTKRNKILENDETNTEQPSDDVKDDGKTSEQERTSTKKNETSENEEIEPDEPSGVSTPGFKDHSDESEQERTSTINKGTLENEEPESEKSSDVSTPGSVSEQERTSNKKNETMEDEETNSEQPSYTIIPDVKDSSGESEQEGTTTKNNETSENEERKPKQLSDVSTVEVQDNSTASEEDMSDKKNETSENEERKPKESSDGGTDEVNNETENIGDDKTSEPEEKVAVTRMYEHYKERDHDFNHETTASWPLFHYQKNDTDTVMYGCYGFIEPKGKVRSTYYIYDSSGYHAVTPEEQFQVILGPLKDASDERDPQGHQRDKRKVKQWNYQYFLYKCGEPLPRTREVTEMTTESSSTVDSDSYGVQEKALASTEGLPEPSKPSNDVGNDQKPGDEKPPGHEEAFVSTQRSEKSAETSTTPKISNLGPQQVTPEPPKSFSVSGNELSPPHREGFEVPQKSGVSTESSDTPETSQTEGQQFTPKPPNASVNGERPIVELASGHEGRSSETSSASEKSNLITTELPKPSNAPRDGQPPGEEGGSGVPQNSEASISTTPETPLLENQVTPESTKHANYSGNEDNLGDRLPPGLDEGPGVYAKSGESVEISNISETSHFTPEPTKTSNVLGNEQTTEHEGGSAVQHSGVPAEIITTQETTVLDNKQVTSEPAKPSNGSENEETPGEKPPPDHDEGSDLPRKTGESAEISTTPSDLNSQQVTSEPIKSSNALENRETHGDEQFPGHEGGSSAPEKSRESAEIKHNPETSHLGSLQVTPEPPKSSNASGNEENHGDEKSPGHEEESGIPKNTGESAEISNIPNNSDLEGQQVTSEPHKPSENEGNSRDVLPPDLDEGSGVTKKSGELTEISKTSETLHLDSQQFTPEPPNPSNTSENAEKPGDPLSSDTVEGSGVSEKSTFETIITPESSHLEATQESLKPSNIPENGEALRNELSSTHEEGTAVPKKSEGSAEISTSTTAETTHLENQQNKTESAKPAIEEERENEETSADVSKPENVMALNDVDSQEASYSNGWGEGLIA